MTNRDTVLTYIANSEKLRKALYNISLPEFYDDAYSHFILQMCEMKEEKLIKAYDEGYIDWLSIRVMTLQFKGNKRTSFYKLYRENKHLPLQVDFLDFQIEKETSEGFKFHNKYPLVDKLLTLNEENVFDYDKFLASIKVILQRRHWYHKKLFELYYLENKTYKQIEIETGINFQTVRLSVIATKEWIKNELKNAI